MRSSYSERIQSAVRSLQRCDKVIIGGGAGLSAAAGLAYEGEWFEETFAPFIEKYGFADMYSPGFYPFETEEERWAYWAQLVWVNRFAVGAMPLYKELLDLIKEKDYFVISTNVDGQFEKAGFDKSRVFATQGDYRFVQCSKACHDGLYDNEALVAGMLKSMKNCAVQSYMVPTCPKCGGPMMVHVRSDKYFVQNKDWYDASGRYDAFLRKTKGRRALFFELGVGYNTPGIIRFPFEEHVYENSRATLIRINRDFADGATENEQKTIAFDEDMNEVMGMLNKRMAAGK